MTGEGADVKRAAVFTNYSRLGFSLLFTPSIFTHLLNVKPQARWPIRSSSTLLPTIP